MVIALPARIVTACVLSECDTKVERRRRNEEDVKESSKQEENKEEDGDKILPTTTLVDFVHAVSSGRLLSAGTILLPPLSFFLFHPATVRGFV